MKPIKLLWSGGKTNSVNYGDDLSRFIVQETLERDIVYGDATSADLAAIGSILNKIEKRSWLRPFRLNFKPLTIWGSGAINGKLKGLPNCNVLALRGPVSASLLNKKTAYGDPALLLPNFLPEKKIKKFKYCLIPHVSERNEKAVQDIKNNLPNSVVADLGDPDFKKTTDLITSSDYVLSSSLHGLIVADAYQVPRARITISNKIVGGNFKFFDYFSSVCTHSDSGLTPSDLLKEPPENTFNNPKQSQIAALQKDLIGALKKYEA